MVGIYIVFIFTLPSLVGRKQHIGGWAVKLRQGKMFALTFVGFSFRKKFSTIMQKTRPLYACLILNPNFKRRPVYFILKLIKRYKNFR